MTRETVAILDRIKPSTLFREIFEHGGRTIHGAELEIEAAGSPAPRTLLHLLNDELSTDGSVVTGDDGRSVDPSCVNASNPYHRCTVHCFARASKTIRRSWGAKLVQKGESRTTKSRDERRNVDPMCVNASNPYHQCTEYCAQRNPEAKRRISRVQKGERSIEESRVIGGGRDVDPMCIYASNPYHQCTKYCAQRTPEARRRTEGKTVITKVPNGERRKDEDTVTERGRNLDPMCIYTSNPYHQCTDYCLQRTPEARTRHEEVRQKEKCLEESEAVRMRRRNVDPMCVNASNPYHRCTQYCSQRTPEARVQTQGGKSDINGEGSSEERSSVRGRHVDPMCPNASNPYHRCTEYCSQRTPEAMRRAKGK